MNKKILFTLFLILKMNLFSNIYEKLKKDYIENKAPKISDEKIHKFKFEDVNEKLVDLTDKKYRNEKIFFPYSSHPYKFKVREGLQKALFKMVEFLPKDIAVFVYNGYRPLKVQKEMFNKSFLREKQKNPSLTDKELYKKVSKYLSPVGGVIAPHCTGGAIDMVLINIKTKKLLPMGNVFEANKKSHTFYKYLSKEQKKNRKILLKAALRADLVNYPYEFWHFSYGDNYWAYYMNRKPLYNIIIGK